MFLEEIIFRGNIFLPSLRSFPGVVWIKTYRIFLMKLKTLTHIFSVEGLEYIMYCEYMSWYGHRFQNLLETEVLWDKPTQTNLMRSMWENL